MKDAGRSEDTRGGTKPDFSNVWPVSLISISSKVGLLSYEGDHATGFKPFGDVGLKKIHNYFKKNFTIYIFQAKLFFSPNFFFYLS